MASTTARSENTGNFMLSSYNVDANAVVEFKLMTKTTIACGIYTELHSTSNVLSGVHTKQQQMIKY